MDLLGAGQRVELPPALVEQHPGDHRGVRAQMGHRAAALPHPLALIGDIIGAEPPLMGRRSIAVIAPAPAPQRRLVAGFPTVVGAPARHHVLPHQHAKPIAMVVPAVGLHLQVLAHHVETGVPHGLNVEGKRSIGGRRHKAVGPVALVEHPAQKQRLAVQEEAEASRPIWRHLHRAEGGVAAHDIGAEAHGDVVKTRVVGAPAAHLAEIEPQAYAAGRPRLFRRRLAHRHRALFGESGAGGHLAARRVAHVDAHQTRVPAHIDIRRQSAGIGVGMQRQGQHATSGNDLHPHRLPNATLGRVPDAARLEPLLAPRLGTRIARIANAQGDHELPRRRRSQVGRLFEIVLSLPTGSAFRVSDTFNRHVLNRCFRALETRFRTPLAGCLLCPQRLGDVEGKRQIPSLVSAHDLAVHAAGAGEIHGLEMQQAALALAQGGNGHAAHVPQKLVGLKLAPHPRQQGLGREGHEDAPIERIGRPHGAMSPHGDEGVVPPAVERRETVAGELRARVLAAHGFRIQRLAPAREQRTGSARVVVARRARQHSFDVHGPSFPQSRTGPPLARAGPLTYE